MRKNILILYTGGTMGMAKGATGYSPRKGYLEKLLSHMPELQSEELPQYTIVEFSPLYDSSDIGPNEWNKILYTLEDNYNLYDGFIVIHGTDTMAYTASALSFMIEGLDKNIIFTGSQIPLCEIRNDARENLITSLILCANYSFNQVCIYFNGVLLRGNRTIKTKVSGFNAFYSPNRPPIGNIGAKFDIQSGSSHAMFKQKSIKSLILPDKPVYFREISIPYDSIACIRLYPGISQSFCNAIAKLPLRGLVIEAFGTGNAQSTNSPFVKDFIAELKEKECIVVVCSQCIKGNVFFGDYSTSLKSTGALSGHDMTPEACLAKLYYALSLPVSLEEKKALFNRNLRGEVSLD